MSTLDADANVCSVGRRSVPPIRHSRTQRNALTSERTGDCARLNIEEFGNVVERLALPVENCCPSIELRRAHLLNAEVNTHLFELASDGLAMAVKLFGQFGHGFACLV